MGVLKGTHRRLPVRVTFLLTLLVVSAACSARSPADPSAPLAAEFQLRQGEAVVVQGTTLALRFDRLVTDSRCPADAICVWQGDAAIALGVREGSAPESSYELHTDQPSRSEVSHGRYRIRLVRLEPYPFSSSPIPPQSYRAVLLVSRG